MTKVFYVESEDEAQIKACEVYTFFDADLVVYRTPTPEAATGKGLWYVSKTPDDAIRIFWLRNDTHADIRIFFAPAEFEAGWKPDSAIREKYEEIL